MIKLHPVRCTARAGCDEQVQTNSANICEVLPVGRPANSRRICNNFYCTQLNAMPVFRFFGAAVNVSNISYLRKYWGWCKYRFHEAEKKNFQAAKDAVKEYLAACPTDVIRRFINRSWRYLCGKAAAWAVQKQRQHRQVSECAVLPIEAILD